MFLKERIRSIVNNNTILWNLKRRTYDRFLEGKDKLSPKWVQCPQDVQIDTHNYCSCACEFCNVKESGSYKIPRGRMEDWMLKYIIDYWAQYPHMEYICPYINGEPMLDDRLPWICDYSLEKGKKIVIDTNGNLYRNHEYLVHPNLTLLRFSICAITRETYEKVHGVDKFWDAINTFKYVAKNRYPSQQIELHFIVTKNNEHEIKEYIKYFRGFRIKIFPLHRMPGIQLDSEKVLGIDEKWIQDSSSLERWIATRPLSIYPNGCMERMITPSNKTCQGMDFAIMWDGTILHCTDAPPKYNHGKIPEKDMLEAWHERNHSRINNPACIACNAKRPDWKEILCKYGLAKEDEQ